MKTQPTRGRDQQTVTMFPSFITGSGTLVMESGTAIAEHETTPPAQPHMTRTTSAMGQVEVKAPPTMGSEEILTPEALAFLAALHREFCGRRHDVLVERQARRARVHEGHDLDFDPATASVREDATWRVAPISPGLADRRVEITGPTDRKMTINALNSGARVWMADLEDANTPAWSNVIEGQLSLRDAIRGTISYTSDENKHYELNSTTLTELPTIMVRPRGWHLSERHLRVQGVPMSGSLVDFGLYFFHNAKELLARGRGPYFYLPKIESATEARLWNDVFIFAQEYCNIAAGTIRATVLIETLPAAFAMEEILYELREHSAGLNAGRWDYIFSAIKFYRKRGEQYVLPDRAQVTMTAPFMRAYTELLVKTCHRRGAHAIGGMAAFIPNRKDPEATERAFAQVRADKQREAGDGFDGSWVAHPGLVPVAQEVFDATLGEQPNQLERQRDEVKVTASMLLDFPTVETLVAQAMRPLAQRGTVTEAGVRTNVAVGLGYLEAWLRGHGAVALNNLMEDAATAEISRSQLWQWLHYRTPVHFADGTVRSLTPPDVERMLMEEMADLHWTRGLAEDRTDEAAALLRESVLEDEFPTFITIPAYARYVADTRLNKQQQQAEEALRP